MNADIITTIEQGTGRWFYIALFLFILLCLAMLCLEIKIRQVKKYKKILCIKENE